MPMFGHSHREESNAPPESASAAGSRAADTVNEVLGWIGEMSPGQRAARIMDAFKALEGTEHDRLSMDELALNWLPGEIAPGDGGIQTPIPPEQISWDDLKKWYAARKLIETGLQALEMSRLVCRTETTTNRSGTLTRYFVSEDGKASLQRGDVADVVTRRLPD